MGGKLIMITNNSSNTRVITNIGCRPAMLARPWPNRKRRTVRYRDKLQITRPINNDFQYCSTMYNLGSMGLFPEIREMCSKLYHFNFNVSSIFIYRISSFKAKQYKLYFTYFGNLYTTMQIMWLTVQRAKSIFADAKLNLARRMKFVLTMHYLIQSH